jgi:transcription elongation factor GreA-like protein
MKELVQWARALKNEHPDKFDEIWELVDLCYDEIEQGGSPEHEIELCKESIIQLLDNDTED